MKSKFTISVLSLLLLVALLAVVSCVEEPTIAPVKRSFSLVRIGNLTTNLDQIEVTFGGEVVASSLNNMEFTDYFQVASGKDKMIVTDLSSGSVVFDKLIDAVSYEEITMYFSGYYHPNIDSTSFGFFSASDGITYLAENPGSDSLYFRILHASGDTPSDSTRKVDLRANFIEKDSSTASDSVFAQEFEFGAAQSLHLREGSYDLTFLKAGAENASGVYVFSTDTIAHLVGESLSSGNRTYFYVFGDPNSMSVDKQELQFNEVLPK